MKKRISTLLVWIFLVAGFLVLFGLTSHKRPIPTFSFERFKQDIEDENVREVTIDRNQLIVSTYGRKDAYRTLGILDDALLKRLSEDGVVVGSRQSEEESGLTSALIGIFPIVAVFIGILFFLKRMNRGNETWMSLRKTRAKVAPESSKTTFAQVGGCEEAKESLGDVVDFLKNPERWTKSGARMPRGILLEGPSGSGKTLLARAVAGETNATFYFVSASEFVELFVGVGAARVRDTFEVAAKKPPAVIFIDEIDAVGRRRGSGLGAGHDEREQTLNQLLVCLDGFQPTTQIVVIAATNRADILDPALVRSGRFDRRISIPPLNEAARLEVLKIHSAGKPLSADVSLEAIAKETAGFSGAQIENLMNEAALLAVRRSRIADGAAASITRADIEQVLNPSNGATKKFSSIDQLLIESATQLAQSKSETLICAKLRNGTELKGHLVWADAAHLKLRLENGEFIVLPKIQVLHYQSLGQDNGLSEADISCDAWAGKNPSPL